MNKIEICNLALDNIGASSIQTLDEDTREAAVCSLHYPLALEFALADFDWAFARKPKTLALSTETYPGWNFAYVRPTDCLAPRKIFNAASDNEEDAIPYDIGVAGDLNTNLILTNQEQAILIYTAKVVNTAVFTPGFCQMLSTRLSSEMAIPLMSDQTLAEKMKAAYATALSSAKSNSANAKKKVATDHGSFYNAR